MRCLIVSILTLALATGCVPRSPDAVVPDDIEDASLTAPDSQGEPDEWPFDSPKNQAVITLDRIINGQSKILYVTHDASDGTWQFLDGGDVIESDAMVVGLAEMVEIDPTLKNLADLPEGWFAERSGPDDPWKRTKKR